MHNYFPYYQTNFQVRADNSSPENQFINPYQALHERNRILNQQQSRQQHIEPGIITRTYQEPPKTTKNTEIPHHSLVKEPVYDSNTNYTNPASQTNKPVVPYSKLFDDTPTPVKPPPYKMDKYTTNPATHIPSPIIPVIDKQNSAKPVIVKSTFTKPVTNEPVTNKPVVNKPVVNKPVVNKPVVVKPVNVKQVVNEPVMNEPVMNEPVMNEQVVNEPVMNEPVMNEQVVNEPVIVKQVVNEPVIPGRTVLEPVIIKHISNKDNQTEDKTFATKLNTEYQSIMRMLSMDLNDDNKPKNIEKPVNAVKGGNKICSQKPYYNKMSEENTVANTNTGDVETWPKLTSANINTSFKVVGDILPAQKVNIIDNCCLAIDNSYVSGYFRYTSGQSREKLMSFLVHLLEEAKLLAEDLLTSIRTSYRENPGNNNVVNNKLPELRNFHRNLIAFLHKFDTMKNVYHDDSKTYASLGDIRNNFYTFEDSFYRDLVLGVE